VVGFAIRSPRILLFVAVATAVYGCSIFIASRLAHVRHPDVVAAGVLIDTTIVVPAAFFFLFLREKRRIRGLIPIALLSLAATAVILPASYRGAISQIRLVALPAELGLIGYLVWRARQRFAESYQRAQQTDIVAALADSCEVIFGNPRLARMIAYEVTVLYFALFGWFSRAQPSEALSFSYHRKGGYAVIVGVVVMLAAIEVVGTHLLLQGWSVRLAWLLTALGLYGLIWMIGDFQAIRLRPFLVHDDAIEIRVAFEQIARVSACTSADVPSKRARGYLHAAVLTDPQFMIELRGPTIAAGPYGVQKTIARIGVDVDEAARFRSALTAKGLLG
jgi:hypothetical protein